MNKLALQESKDRYYLYEIADILDKDERYVLDLAEKGLTFSLFVSYAELEVHQCEKHIEDEINGHEIMDLEVTKQGFLNYNFEALDLWPLTPLQLARGVDKVVPEFNIKGWHRAIIKYCEPKYAFKDNIFVTASNINSYRKIDSSFNAAFKKIVGQKPGPSADKKEQVKREIREKLQSNSELTIQEIAKTNQESLVSDYGHIASRNTIVAAAREMAEESKES